MYICTYMYTYTFSIYETRTPVYKRGLARGFGYDCVFLCMLLIIN